MHEGIEIARMRSTYKNTCDYAAYRQCARALLLAIAGMLVSCGGGGPAPAASGGAGGDASIACATGGASDSADLSWDAVTNPVPDGYRIYYGTATGSYTTMVDVGLTTMHTVIGLISGTYYFAATAYSSNGESIVSNEVCKTIS